MKPTLSAKRPIVIKLGGEVVGGPVGAAVAADIATLTARGEPVVVVHGGGPQATALQKSLGIEPHIVGGIGCYVISVVVWILALSRVEVSIAYPMLSIGYVVNAIAAWYFLGEAVTPMRLVGIGIIIVGVYVVARS